MAGYPIPNLSLGAGCLSCQAVVSQHADLLGIVLKMPSYIVARTHLRTEASIRKLRHVNPFLYQLKAEIQRSRR